MLGIVYLKTCCTFVAVNHSQQHKQNTNVMKASYKEAVLASNKAMKQECKSLGYALRLIEQTEGVNDELRKVAKHVSKASEAYQKVSNEARKSKGGSFVPFYVLQYLFKNSEALLSIKAQKVAASIVDKLN